MRIATGRVVAGRVVMEGAPLRDGTTVTVIAQEADEAFDLGPDEEAAILAAIAEADRGETVDGDEVLRSLGPSR